jgi:hypothetical protein
MARSRCGKCPLLESSSIREEGQGSVPVREMPLHESLRIGPGGQVLERSKAKNLALNERRTRARIRVVMEAVSLAEAKHGSFSIDWGTGTERSCARSNPWTAIC